LGWLRFCARVALVRVIGRKTKRTLLLLLLPLQLMMMMTITLHCKFTLDMTDFIRRPSLSSHTY
jgi:hypothetical protein